MWTVFLIFCNSWITTRVALTQAKGKSISYFRDISLMHASRTLRWSQIPDMWPRCVEAFEQPWCALMSEQNGSRIMRALLEVALSKKWAHVSAVLMSLSKAVERRIWPFENPMKQFQLHLEVLHNLQRWADDLAPTELASKTAAELGHFIHMNERHGAALLNAAKQFPSAKIAHVLRPLTPDLLKILIQITPAFDWNSKVHGFSEPFWIWVEDHTGALILQYSHLQFRQDDTSLSVDFVLGIKDQVPPSVTLRFLSDTWIGAEEEIYISLEDLIMPSTASTHLERLDIPFLSPQALHNGALETSYASSIRVFNSIQSRCFWSLYNTSQNVSVCGPVCSGKSLCGQLAIWYVIGLGTSLTIKEALSGVNCRSTQPNTLSLSHHPIMRQKHWERVYASSAVTVRWTS